MIDKKYYDENKILNELYFKTFMNDGIKRNPNYDPNKPTYKFNDKEIIELRDTTLLYESQNYFEFGVSLVVELMDYYNIKSSKELYDLIRPKEVEYYLTYDDQQQIECDINYQSRKFDYIVTTEQINDWIEKHKKPLDHQFDKTKDLLLSFGDKEHLFKNLFQT